MFNFSTTQVINNITDLWSKTVGAADGVTVGYRHLAKTNIVSSFFKAPTNGTTATATFTAGEITAIFATPGTYRLVIESSLSAGAQSAAFDRWDVYKGKPFYAEFTTTAALTTAAGLGAVLSPAVKNLVGSFDDGRPVASVNATTGVITASSPYVIFNEVHFELLQADGSFSQVGVSKSASGTEPFGTSWYLLKNLRLPTCEAVRLGALHKDERPIDGKLYSQYIVVMEVDRDFTGPSAVGQKMKSRTEHVFWVSEDANTAFAAEWTKAGFAVA